MDATCDGHRSPSAGPGRMEAAIEGTDRLLPSRLLGSDGLAAYRLAQRKGREGIIAKDAASGYEERRSGKWLKVKVHQ